MANKICKYCCGCGFKVGMPGYYPDQPSLVSPTTNVWPVGGSFSTDSQKIKCKACSGTGWIDDEKLITVPIKFVKEEYFKTNE